MTEHCPEEIEHVGLSPYREQIMTSRKRRSSGADDKMAHEDKELETLKSYS